MFELHGFDDAIKKLKRLGSNARELAGSHDVPVSELFTPTFMQHHTKVASFEALIEAGGFKVESPADFQAIPSAEWENVVRSHTSFSSWQEMVEKAGEEYVSKKVMDGL